MIVVTGRLTDPLVRPQQKPWGWKASRKGWERPRQTSYGPVNQVSFDAQFAAHRDSQPLHPCAQTAGITSLQDSIRPKSKGVICTISRRDLHKISFDLTLHNASNSSAQSPLRVLARSSNNPSRSESRQSFDNVPHAGDIDPIPDIA